MHERASVGERKRAEIATLKSAKREVIGDCASAPLGWLNLLQTEVDVYCNTWREESSQAAMTHVFKGVGP